MKTYSLVFIFLFIAIFPSLSQIPSQVIKGRVVDTDARFGIVGVNVVLYQDTVLIKGASTDLEGYYRIEGVPLGRYRLVFLSIGYNTGVKAQVIIDAGKEMVIDMELEESILELETVTVTAYNKNETVNEMALVSTRMFDAQETQRYAGSRQDPARMASNFAGVQGADDSRNDIVIRGNSPLGVLWKVEGVNIPNPNHFGVSGSTGGPVSILNNKTIAKSDFFTGAFPAEYGNSLAGVFDLNLRNGNQDKHEFSGQFGFLGTEVMAEGPINKDKRSTYIATYRYSTASIFSALGIDIGTDAVPKYQDASFRINMPLKNNASISFFGLGGSSDIDIVISNQNDTSEVDLYGDNDRDQYFGTQMGVLAATYERSVNSRLFLNSTFSTSIENQRAEHNYVFRQVDAAGSFAVDSIVDYMRYTFSQTKLSNASYVNYKINKKHVIKAGFNYDFITYNYQDSIDLNSTGNWLVRWNYEGSASLIQAYAQLKSKLSNSVTMNLGWHSQLYSLNDSKSLFEPRISLKWAIDEKQSISGGFGLHSQLQPQYNYFYRSDIAGIVNEHNSDMDFSRSTHYVLAYDKLLSDNIRIKLETYYQTLSDIPIELTPSSFSLLNQGSAFSRFFPNKLENKGTGTNYGLEFTAERFFSKGYFLMFTGTIYDSKYIGSDGIERNTDFNGNFVVNLLGGTEKKIGRKSSLGIGGTITLAGGKRYGIVDNASSILERELIYLDEDYNEYQFKNYFRTDLKLNYKLNTKKTTHELAVDLVNIFATENILSLTYAPVPGSTASPIRKNFQLGRLPVFYYKIDF